MKTEKQNETILNIDVSLKFCNHHLYFKSPLEREKKKQNKKVTGVTKTKLNKSY